MASRITVGIVAVTVLLLICPPMSQAQPDDGGGKSFARFGIGGGINNRVSSEPETLGDLGGTLNIEIEAGLRFKYIALNWYSELTIREWGTIGNFYDRLTKDKGKEVVYGYLFGWLAGTDLIYTGPSFTLYPLLDEVPVFASAGVGGLLLIDPRDPNAEAGYGQTFAIGYGSEKAGIALRTIFSHPDQHGDLARPDPTYYNVFITFWLGKKKKSDQGALD